MKVERRDVSQDLDDRFEILIDSNHDRRRAYVFQVNPLGPRMASDKNGSLAPITFQR